MCISFLLLLFSVTTESIFLWWQWIKIIRNMLKISDYYWILRKQSQYCSIWTMHRLKYIKNNVKTSIYPVFLLRSNYIICNDLYYPPFYENCENRCTLSLSREQTANMTIPKMKTHFWDDTLSRAPIRIKIPLSECFNFLMLRDLLCSSFMKKTF